MTFSFNFYGVEQIKSKLNRFANEISSYKEVFEDISEDFFEIEKRQFSSEGGRSKKWYDLSPTYATWKNKNFPGRPILVLTGELKESLTVKDVDPYYPVITKNQCILGTSDPKAEWHFLGMSETNLPIRRSINLIDKDKSRWMKLIHEYVDKVGRGLGFKI